VDDHVSAAFGCMFFFYVLCRCDMKMMVNEKASEDVFNKIYLFGKLCVWVLIWQFLASGR